MASHAHIDALARTVIRPGSSSWAPRPVALSLHQGAIAAVDYGTNTLQWLFNGDAVPTSGIRYLQAYSAENPPMPGDVAWAHYNGTNLLVLGRHVVPEDSTIILP